MANAITKTNPRLGLLDVMILTAAIGVGLGWAKFLASIPGHVYNQFSTTVRGFGEPGGPAWRRAMDAGWSWYTVVAPVTATLAVGLLAVRLRARGRDRRRRLLQPGAAACLAITAVLAVSAVRLGGELLSAHLLLAAEAARGATASFDWWEPAYRALRPTEPGIAVIGCWAVLAGAGRMRCERSTVDRLGRLVAVYWIVAMIWSWLGD